VGPLQAITPGPLRVVIPMLLYFVATRRPAWAWGSFVAVLALFVLWGRLLSTGDDPRPRGATAVAKEFGVPQSLPVPPGSNIRRIYLDSNYYGQERYQVFFVAKGPVSTHVGQARRCVRRYRGKAPAIHCVAYPSDEAFNYVKDDPNVTGELPAGLEDRPCASAHWGTNPRDPSERVFGGPGLLVDENCPTSAAR
ncbi:MAG: hypothetical protein WDZ37_00260, partial [Solirubrobacterales bacterium]